MNFLAQKRSKILLKNSEHTAASPATKDNPDRFFYKEIAKLTGSGAWSVDFKKKETYVDAEARRQLEIPAEYHVSLKNAIDFCSEEHQTKAIGLYLRCANGHSATTTIRMKTYTGRVFWVRATAEPIVDANKQVVGIRGVFQNIHNDKQKEMRLVRSLKTIEAQNTQLNSFTSIITHNLRSHVSNLRMTMELLSDSADISEQQELLDTIKEISTDLNTVVGHIGELGAIQMKSKEAKSQVSFQKSLDRVQRDLHMTLNDSQTEIFSDFSELPEVPFSQCYMDSIFMNLITNAVKYAEEGRNPVIEIFSYQEGDDNYLMVRDNGSGIDLEKHGNRIFNMYQTFHDHNEAEGIGLFLLKNRIESLEGTISIQSELGKGTTFTIRF